MNETLRPQTTGSISPLGGEVPVRHSVRGARPHPLVASLAGGLQTIYAAQGEDEVTVLFAGLIARLDSGEPEVR